MKAIFFLKRVSRVVGLSERPVQAGVSGALVSRPILRLLGTCLFAFPLGCAAEIQWQEPWSVRSNGQLLSVETFSSSLPPDAVAQALARQHGAYQRYLVGAGRILLSGVSQGEHWLADIQGYAQGSQGYVSALYFDAAGFSSPSSETPAGGRELTAAVHMRLSEAGLGRPVQIFEFEDSASVSLVSSPDVAAVDSGSLTLITSDPQGGTALAISMPEY